MPQQSRSFVLKHATDSAPVPCKWKPGTKKHGPQVAFNDTYVNVRHVTTITLNEWLFELYQTSDLTSSTPLEDVFNIPLVSEILVYPLIMRVTGLEEVPSLGRVKKLLCEYLIENADNSFFPDGDEEDLQEDLQEDLPSLSDNEPIELPDFDEDEDSEDDDEDDDDDDVDNLEDDDEDEVDVMDDDE